MSYPLASASCKEMPQLQHLHSLLATAGLYNVGLLMKAHFLINKTLRCVNLQALEDLCCTESEAECVWSAKNNSRPSPMDIPEVISETQGGTLQSRQSAADQAAEIAATGSGRADHAADRIADADDDDAEGDQLAEAYQHAGVQMLP